MTNPLYLEAKKMLQYAYAPYSNFQVGAAVQTKNGNIYTGCNIENSSYSLTCCAERVAIFQAIQAGDKKFTTMAVIANRSHVISPCGACRQVMAEFFSKNVDIYLYNKDGESVCVHMSQLLPNAFSLS